MKLKRKRKRKLLGVSHAALFSVFAPLLVAVPTAALIDGRGKLSRDSTVRRNAVRGEKYSDEQSTLPSPAIVADRLGVKPTKEASPETWQRAWKLHKRLLPVLHSTDRCRPPDSSLNIACMWWKALAGNDKSSPAYDRGLAYDLLPSGWRNVVRPRRLYPRLHHGNVELRTAFLDGAVADAAREARRDGRGDGARIRLVCLGAGYDTRGVKMLERGLVDEVVELDLPTVVAAKKRLFARLLRRRPGLRSLQMPTLVPADFNDDPAVLEQKLGVALDEGITADPLAPAEKDWYTIFVFEGVMIYLKEGVPTTLLGMTSSALQRRRLDGALCFADRLENIPGGEFDAAVQELEKNGWRIKDWCPKPGLARHMGSAELMYPCGASEQQ